MDTDLADARELGHEVLLVRSVQRQTFLTAGLEQT
jgi:hypothetical protein